MPGEPVPEEPEPVDPVPLGPASGCPEVLSGCVVPDRVRRVFCRLGEVTGVEFGLVAEPPEDGAGETLGVDGREGLLGALGADGSLGAVGVDGGESVGAGALGVEGAVGTWGTVGVLGRLGVAGSGSEGSSGVSGTVVVGTLNPDALPWPARAAKSTAKAVVAAIRERRP